MRPTTIFSAASTLTLSAFLVACGGGGGSSSSSEDSSNTESRSVTSSGTVTQFGSVYVNGIHYETEDSQIISADDDTVLLSNPTNAQLQSIIGLGQVIIVRGSKDNNGNGVADQLIVDNEIVGEVISVDTSNGTFEILGQLVGVTPETIIDDSLIEAVRGVEIPSDLRFGDLPETLDQLLPLGTIVEVSGFPSNNGFTATRIEDKTSLGSNFEAEVKGTINNLTASQFTLNNLTVFYDAADLDPVDFNSISLEVGQFVEVHGTIISSTSIDATRIQLEDSRFDDDFNFGVSEFEIEGIIQTVTPNSSGAGGTITINGAEIPVDNISTFNPGMYIEIEGSIQSNGSLLLAQVKDHHEENIRTKDIVVSNTASDFTTRLGLTITPSERTELEDETLSNDDNLSINQFLTGITGKRIEAKGFPLNGSTVWRELELDNNSDQSCQLQGPIANISGDATSFNFTIEGITINTDQVSSNHFESDTGMLLTKAAFFSDLSDGVIIKAKSDNQGVGCSNGELTARELEFEAAETSLYLSNSDDSNSTGFDNELIGSISNLSANSFTLAGLTINVTNSTVIDDSLIEAAVGFEVEESDTLGNLSLSLTDLLSNGLMVEVKITQNNGSYFALEIEDL